LVLCLCIVLDGMQMLIYFNLITLDPDSSTFQSGYFMVFVLIFTSFVADVRSGRPPIACKPAP